MAARSNTLKFLLSMTEFLDTEKATAAIKPTLKNTDSKYRCNGQDLQY